MSGILFSLRVALFLAFLTACSSNVVVHEISGPPKNSFCGIPIQLAAVQQITVYQLQPNGTYSKVEATQYPIADQSRLFSVGINTQVFSNATLNLALNDDGTAKSVAISSTPSGASAITQLGSSLSTVVTSAATYDEQRQKAQQAALQQSLATLQAQQAGPNAQNALVLAYHQALINVMNQQALINNPPPGTTPLNLIDDQNALQVLELQANQAAGALALPAPFPAANQLP
jgi:hypothetical protein